MNSIMAKISKEISQEKQEAHIVMFKLHGLQIRCNQAFELDDSHTKRISKN